MSTRRLPVYLVIDCSESMAGPAFEAVQRGLALLLNELRGNPQALETAWISLITFARTAKVLVPLTEIGQFKAPNMVLGSGTALGDGLLLLEKQIKTEIHAQTAERKGDWKPIVFILTDGDPTDNWKQTADRFKSEIVGKKANVIAVACGNEANVSLLKHITENVLQLKEGSEVGFSAFFKWVSASVQASSVKFSTGNTEAFGLPALPPNMEVAVESVTAPSDNRVFLEAKCSQSKRFYLICYIKEATRSGFMSLFAPSYIFKKSYPLDDFDFETRSANKLSISSDKLGGEPSCPYCSNRLAAMCE